MASCLATDHAVTGALTVHPLRPSHKDLKRSCQQASWKRHSTLQNLLRKPELDKSLLNYYGATALSTTELLHLHLAVSIAFIEDRTGPDFVRKLLFIVWSLDFDSGLFSARIKDLKRCRIYAIGLSEIKHHFPIVMFSRKSEHASTISVVV